ncbi:MAG: extracellular solute-binding protein [Treponema sp.]
MKKFFGLLFVILCMISCKGAEDSIAVIWTDRVEFAIYAHIFNTTQNEYKITVSYKENPAESVIKASDVPDIVVGPWLKGDAARSKFLKINDLLTESAIHPDSFYPALLELGSVDGTHFLLPVSFNLPVIIFSSSQKDGITNHFSLSLEEMQRLAKEYNRKNQGEYTRMGFSPRWDMNFLYVTAQGMQVSFEETKQLFSWNQHALDAMVQYIRQWSHEVNTDSLHEDEFKFKYLYDPPYTLVSDGRCLFWYLPSNSLFSLPQEKLKTIDYRWMTYNDKTPLQDDIVYAGICKNAKNKEAAKAFLQWFFQAETQKALLERFQAENMIAPSFGLAGGFSSIKSVTETIFPAYYPLLLKRLPQTTTFSAPNVLPNNWEQIKKDLLYPYFEEQTGALLPTDKPATLNKRIADWYKQMW